jgi:hypothetical protein
MTNTPSIWESHLPAKLGVPRDWIREVREKFAEKTDWWTEGQRVVWAISSIPKLVEAMAQFEQVLPEFSAQSPDTQNQKKCAPEANTEVSQCLKIEPEKYALAKVLGPCPNNRFAWVSHDGKKTTVRVKDAARLRKGMMLTCVIVDGRLEATGIQKCHSIRQT